MHSAKFETLKKKFEMNFITRETLWGWVEVDRKSPGKGITEAEYNEIVDGDTFGDL